MERVTADSNIWISGLNWRGKPHELLDLARDGKIELAVSEPILDEVSRILHDKFAWSVDRLSALRTEIATFTKHVSPDETIDAVQSDHDDNRILECAVTAGSDVVVTGDTDPLMLGSFRGIKMLRVSDFLAGFQSRGR